MRQLTQDQWQRAFEAALDSHLTTTASPGDDAPMRVWCEEYAARNFVTDVDDFRHLSPHAACMAAVGAYYKAHR